MRTDLSGVLLDGFAAESACVEIHRIDDVNYELTSMEERCVRSALAARRREFTAGRGVAHCCLRKLGQAAASLLADENRCPIWPIGFVGSISHTASHVGAVVADSAAISSLGFDIEKRGAVTPDLYSFLFTDDEQDAIDKVAESTDLATRLFVAKEAFYKAVYPVFGLNIEFRQVDVVIERSTFHIILAEPIAAKIELKNVKGVLHAVDDHQVALFVVNNCEH